MSSTPSIQFIRPYSLIGGKDYFYREGELYGTRITTSIVKFVAYDPCPAIVIIIDPSGRKIRCQRDNLFELKENNYQNTPLQLSSNLRGQTDRLEPSNNYA